MEAVLKTVEARAFAGSNPALSASSSHKVGALIIINEDRHIKKPHVKWGFFYIKISLRWKA